MAQYDVDFREYWRVLKKRKFTILFATLALGVFSSLFAVLKTPAPLYTSVCSIKFEKDTTMEGLFTDMFFWSAGGSDIDTQISVLKSFSVMKQVAQELDLIPEGDTSEGPLLNPSMAAKVQALQGKVEVSREGITSIIHISVTDHSPVFAQRLANTIASTYKKIYARDRNQKTTEALKYITSQLKTVRQNLQEAEAEFNTFTQQNQLVSIDLQSENLLARAKEIRDEIRKINEARLELEALVLKLRQFSANSVGGGNELYSGYANEQYQSANNALIGLLLKRDSLLEDFTPRHPEVIEINRKIREASQKMAAMVQSQVNNLDKRKADLKRELADVENKTKVLMEKNLEFNRLKRQVESYNSMVALLEQKNQESLIRKAQKPEEIAIVKPALLPTGPINPPNTVATGAMGVIIGVVLGMIVAFVAETFDTSLGAIEDVEETLGAQVLGVIPHGDIKSMAPSGSEDKDPRSGPVPVSPFRQKMHLASHFARQSILAESFRALRTNIQFRDLEKKIKTLAFTSASPQEGKSMVCTNLTIAMAQAGMKVLLVEADLRKPVIAKAFGLEPGPGLAEVLIGDHSWREVVKTVTDIIVGKMDLEEVMITPGLDQVHILPCGNIPPNPSELIDSKRLTDFIEEAKEEYDIIIFDTPPILSTAEPMILGTKLDAMILVYRVGSISRGLLKRSAVQLTQVRTNLMGVVLNGMKAELSPDFHGFKYYNYYYYRDQKATPS